MSDKCLINQLDVLKISSKEAVEHIDSFSDFKEYMHVERNVQRTLLELINQAASKQQSQLILVCGSVGDGKSHLLSYINAHHKTLLESFRLYNDASESFNPEDTDMDTLNRELNNFSDEVLGEGPIEKVVLAINLGTLSNFIESEYKQRYTKLRDFVYEHKILDNEVSPQEGYIEDSFFQYINFSDYHMFTLTEDGPESYYIEQLLERLVAKEESNVFYTSYQQGCRQCGHRKTCVVKENYHLLQNNQVRKGLVQLIIKTMIREKLIISTREMLNFFNDIMVGGLSKSELIALNTQDISLDKVLLQKSFLLPNIIFERAELSQIIQRISHLDPLIQPNKKLEEELIYYQMTDAIVASIRDELPEFNRLFTSAIAESVGEAQVQGLSHAKLIDVRYEFFKLYKRTKYLVGDMILDETYKAYMRELYYSNQKDRKALKPLIKEIRECIYAWDGDSKAQGIRVGSSKRHRTLSIYEKIKIKDGFDKKAAIQDQPLEKFVPNIIIPFRCGSNSTIINLNIDYSLYELFKKMSKGYLPNREEQNKNLAIELFIEQLLKVHQEGQEDEEERTLIFEEIEGDHIVRYKLTVNDDDEYEFEQVI